MRSNPVHHLLFIFQPENILRSNLNFSTSYGRLTDLRSLLGLLLVTLIWLGERNSLKYLFLSGGRLSPMSRRCRHRLCQNWLRVIFKYMKFLLEMYCSNVLVGIDFRQNHKLLNL